MSHRSKVCFTVQIRNALDARLAIGESKKEAKKQGYKVHFVRKSRRVTKDKKER